MDSTSDPLDNDHYKRPSYERSTSGGRMFYGPVQLLQDWDQAFTAEGASTQYFELFIDLLLVAAASSIADTFKEHHDLGEFVLAYTIILNGWFLYSHHITTRFEDSSFVHSLLLFLYMSGFGWTIVNVGDFRSPESGIQAFAAGALVLRLSILLMLAMIAWTLPRARYFCTVLCWLIIPTMVALAYGGIMSSVAGLIVASATEFFGEVIFANWINMRRFIPVNIEQSKERFGALGLIMLGETVVSVTQTYREFVRSDKVRGDMEEHNLIQTQYYMILVLSLLLIFMITLLIFHVTPEAHEHAIRRSKMHGVLLLLCHKILGLPLLAVGVSVKLVVEAVLEQQELSHFGYRCMSFGVGLTLTLIFLIRYLHYGGKTELAIGEYMWTVGTHPVLDRITTIWWWLIGLSSQIPLVWYVAGLTTRDPLSATAYHALLVFAICLMETSITHSIAGSIAPAAHGAALSSPEEGRALLQGHE
jgi:low temperature requirement protein LtrA